MNCYHNASCRHTGFVLAILVALTMVFTMIPQMVSAADDSQAQDDVTIAISGTVKTSASSVPVTITGNAPEGAVVSVRGYKADLEEIDYTSPWAGNGNYNFNVGTLLDAEAGDASVPVADSSVLTAGLQLVAYVLHEGTPVAHSDIVQVQSSGSIADEADAIMQNCSVELIHEGGFRMTETKAHVKVALDSALENASLTLYACPGNVAFNDENITYYTSLAAQTVTDGFDGDVTFTRELPKYYRVCAVIRAKIRDTEDGGYYRTKASNYVDVLDENGEAFKPYDYPDITIDEDELQAGATTLHVSMTGDERLFAAAADPDVDFSISYSIGMYPDGEDFDFEGEHQIGLLNHASATEAFTGEEITLSEPLREGYRVRAVVYWSQNTDLFVPKSNDYEFNQPDDSVLVTTASTEPKVTLSEVFAGDTSCTANVTGELPDGTMMSVKSFEAGTEPSYEKGTVQKFLTSVSTGETNIEFNNAGELKEGTILVAFLLNGGDPIAQSAAVTVKAVPAPEVSISGKITAAATTIPVRITGKVPADASLLIRMYEADETAFNNDWNGSTFVSSSYASGITVGAGTNEMKVNDGVQLAEGKKLCAFLVYDGNTVKAEPVTIAADTEDAQVSLGEVSTDSESVEVTITGDVPEGTGLLVKSYDKSVTEFAYDKGTPQGFTGNVAAGTLSHTFTAAEELNAGQKVVAFLLSGGNAIAASEPVVVTQGSYSTPTVEITDTEITAGDTSLNFKATFDKALDRATYKVYSFTGAEFDTETAKDLGLGGPMTASGTKTVYIKDKIAEGDKLVVVLTAGGVTVVSEPITVAPSPNWAEPTSSFTVSTVTDSAEALPIKVDYDDNYLTMDDFYCNISVYMFDAAVDDDIFEEDEYWEHTDKAVCVARANYSAGDQTRGEFSIPLLASADLKAGKKLIIKVRVPHQEWEGEEADYLSSSVLITAGSAFAKGPSALLYNIDFDTERGQTIRELLEENNVLYKIVTNEDLDQKIGYLVEKKGYAKNETPYEGEGYKTEFLLMNASDEASYDVFMADDTGLIDRMASEDVSVPHKAMVTATNQEWTLDELVARIADEHAVMTGWMDLWNLTETVKDLNDEAVYGTDAEAWNAFREALGAADTLLAEEDEEALSEETLKVAYDNLRAAAQALKADAATTDAVKSTLSGLTDKAGAYTEARFGKNSNWPEFTAALEEAKAALAAQPPAAGAMAIAADRLGKVMNKLDRVADRQDTQAANAVASAIEALPAVSKIKLSDEAAIMAAKKAYDSLTQAQKAKLDPKTVTALNEAVKKLNALKAASQKITKKKQVIKLRVKTKTVKFKTLKKKKLIVKPITVKKAKGKVTYKIVSGSKKTRKALTLNKKTGKITVKKKTKKGTYKLKIKVTAAGNKYFKAASKTVTINVKVK